MPQNGGYDGISTTWHDTTHYIVYNAYCILHPIYYVYYIPHTTHNIVHDMYCMLDTMYYITCTVYYDILYVTMYDMMTHYCAELAVCSTLQHR